MCSVLFLFFFRVLPIRLSLVGYGTIKKSLHICTVHTHVHNTHLLSALVYYCRWVYNNQCVAYSIGIYVLIQSTVNYLCRRAERRAQNIRKSHGSNCDNLFYNKIVGKIFNEIIASSFYYCCCQSSVGVSPIFFSSSFFLCFAICSVRSHTENQ